VAGNTFPPVDFTCESSMHPERVGPYLIDRKIGAGGMGNVYHGVHETTGQEAAIKVLPASMAREDGFVQRFSREIDALRQLSNRHIVQLFQDGATADGTFYYAMEFVDGVTLTTAITDRKRLPWRDVIHLTMQIAAALKAAHDAGIVHRDLKPSNLMLTKDGVVKLTDFGVASLFASTRLTRTGGVVGTAEYMSPEQARGQRASRRSDLYSLGAVMYAMLTGRPPFTGPSANDILQKHQFAQFDKPSRYVADLPRLVEELVCQLLEKDPAKRLPDALVVMKRLEQIRTRLDLVDQHLESETIERPSPGTTAITDELPPDDEQHHPGPATLVRNMIREDVTSSLVKSPVARFFDNIFVLLTLLALIIFFGLWMRSRNTTSPSSQLEMARSIIEKKASPAWLRARDELLQPLVESKALPDNQPEIQSLINKVDQYEFCRTLQTTPESSRDARSELERLVRQAFDTFTHGDPVEARERLQAVRVIAASDPGNVYLNQFLEETQAQWDAELLTDGRMDLLNHLLLKINGQMDHQEYDAAKLSIEAALRLYSNDRSVTDQVSTLQSLLKQVETKVKQPAAE
jgi:serine/threonine-protein kinase